MKKVRMTISHFRFILFNLKNFDEVVPTFIVSPGQSNDKDIAQ